MIFSRFMDVNLFPSMLDDCNVSRRRVWGHMATVGRRLLPCLLASSQSVLTRMAIKILIMIFFSSFEGTDLSCNMLASCFMSQRWDWAAMGRRRPPWLLRPLLKISYCGLSRTIPTYSYVDKKSTQPTTLAEAPQWMVKLILMKIIKPSFNNIEL